MRSDLYYDRTQLQLIRERYFLETEDSGHLRYLRECQINTPHPSTEIFCSCGLLYDLERLIPAIAYMIWPQFSEEMYGQDHQRVFDYGEFPTPEIIKQREENEKILCQTFGMQQIKDEEIIEDHQDYKRLIQEVFGQTFLETLPVDKVLQDSLDTQHRWEKWAAEK